MRKPYSQQSAKEQGHAVGIGTPSDGETYLMTHGYLRTADGRSVIQSVPPPPGYLHRMRSAAGAHLCRDKPVNPEV